MSTQLTWNQVTRDIGLMTQILKNKNTGNTVLNNIIAELLLLVPKVSTFFDSEGGNALVNRVCNSKGKIISYHLQYHYYLNDDKKIKRVANLIHELTHVSCDLSYDRDMVNYNSANKRKPPAIVVGGIVDGITNTHGIKNEAARQDVRSNKSCVDILYENQSNAQKFLVFAQLNQPQKKEVKDKLNYILTQLNTEYDTCVNQILTYLVLWKVDRTTKFFRMIEQMALDAYIRRRDNAPLSSSVNIRTSLTALTLGNYREQAYTNANISIAKITNGINSSITLPGAMITVVKDKGDNNKNNKEKVLKKALEWLRRGKNGYTFLGATTGDDKLPINAYIKKDDPSIGYITKHGIHGVPTATLILTETMVSYRSKLILKGVPFMEDHNGINGFRGGHGKSQTKDFRLVADQIYDYYKPTYTVNAKSRRVLAAIFHEFGHILHQYLAPDDYFQLAEEHKLIVNGQGSPGVKARHKKIHELGKQVSQYAGTQDNRTGAPEFIAEVFSGLMMGLSYGDEVMAAYKSCGGPEAPKETAHVRTRKTKKG